MRLDRIVIGMDFSPQAIDAARWVSRSLAPEAGLTLVHAICIPEPPALLRGLFPPREALVDTTRVGANQRLREVAELLGPDRSKLEIRVGEPAAQIAEVADDCRADIIVVGKHGERPGVRNRLGTTAEGVLRGSAVPVLLATAPRVESPRHLLVPVDGTAVTTSVLSWAGFLGALFDGSATVLHVISAAVSSAMLGPPPVGGSDGSAVWENGRDRARSVAEAWLSGLETAGMPRATVRAEVAFGEPGQEILAAARRLESDLIVLGYRRHRLMRRALFGSVASEVLRGAECSVLAVPESEDWIEDA